MPTRTAMWARPFVAGVIGLACLIALLFAFSESLSELVKRWHNQEEYSHGFLIPLVSAWLLWSRRHALITSVGHPSWAGLALVLLAGVMHVVGKLSALFVLSQVAFIVALIGFALSFGGFTFLKVVFVPIVFLVFAIPLPYFVDSVLSYRLQLISSELGVFVIRLFQIPVYLEGNIIDLGTYKLQVVDACSGLRYLYPLMSLGFLAAYLFQAPVWQRITVFLSTIPITIAMNSLRIGLVGILVDRWGPQDADGLLHFFEGWIIFIACATLLSGEIYVLALLNKKSFSEVFAPPVIQGDPKRSGPLPGLPVQPILYLSAVCAIGIAAFVVSTRQEIAPPRTAFVSFPLNFGQWSGRSSQLEANVEKGLGLTDYVMSDYKRPDGRWVNFYTAYYASQRNGLSPHSPAVCIPGGGWQISQFERTTSDVQSVMPPYNRVLISKGSDKQLVYYWFEQRGRKVANEWVSKWYLLTDAIFRNRTDGALVRVTTPIYPGERDEDADQRLRAFTADLLPNLKGFLPAETIPELKQSLNRYSGNPS